MKSIIAIIAGAMSLATSVAASAEQVNIYSYRQSFLIDPVVEQFTKDTGIKVNVVFAKKGLAERLEREGKYTKADLVLTTDISRLMELEDKGLVQPVNSSVINKNIPQHLRDDGNEWFALTTRVRNIFASKARVGNIAISYEDLADKKFSGKICTRSGKHPYTVALIASMIEHHGYEGAKTWLTGFKGNLARKPQANDRGQIKAIDQGQCDIALGNSYYFGKMVSDPKQKPAADSVHILFPNQQDRGAHINVSGMALTKYSRNKDATIQLMEYLTGEQAQHIYAEVNMEYPVNTAVKPSTLVASWGDFSADKLAMNKIAENRKLALKLLDQVKFDL
ncbi:extracellular solute-binding protein [Psychrobium sp. 1_MG-2023]|uniref:extracellular solute-binding protein n=1 Tax=Psychrobium sp. 1_MG-2023 TaxID=3062624 RepID=UPI000C32F99D|nr:extracellular solute-binding protein [Psychrobium sp. 1_MG-2023]MDP2560732.1 extracellular solute-binding protein [Psychrobium sp. 1_MG-2023]PKF56624.1 iron ABC transporter substrate-binding protein [Alteromonadales bacterium alter-6D02]